jgi:hypothetical protein
MSHTVEIHSNNVVGPSTCEKVRDQGTSLSNPLAVSDLRLKSWGLCGGGCLACQSTRYTRRLGAISTVDAVGAMVGVEVRLLSLGRIKRIGTLDTIGLDRAGGVRGNTASLVQLNFAKLVVQRCGAVGETCALSLPWMRRLWNRVECVCAGPRAPRDLGQRRARLVVGNVRLSRVWEERKDGGDALRRGGSAGRDGNKQSGVRQALHSTIP